MRGVDECGRWSRRCTGGWRVDDRRGRGRRDSRQSLDKLGGGSGARIYNRCGWHNGGDSCGRIFGRRLFASDVGVGVCRGVDGDWRRGRCLGDGGWSSGRRLFFSSSRNLTERLFGFIFPSGIRVGYDPDIVVASDRQFPFQQVHRRTARQRNNERQRNKPHPATAAAIPASSSSIHSQSRSTFLPSGFRGADTNKTPRIGQGEWGR